MFRIPAASRSLLRSQRLVTVVNRKALLSTKSNPLEGDAGALATRVHHTIAVCNAVAVPIYFIVPDKYTDGTLGKMVGVLLSVSLATHSWIGLNYVATDYVPKVSKALLGPARYVNLGLALLTLFGLSKISIGSPGGIKGVVKGVWNGDPKKDEFDF